MSHHDRSAAVIAEVSIALSKAIAPSNPFFDAKLLASTLIEMHRHARALALDVDDANAKHVKAICACVRRINEMASVDARTRAPVLSVDVDPHRTNKPVQLFVCGAIEPWYFGYVS